MRGHESKVIGIKETAEYELVSGGSAGDVRRWDMRAGRATVSMDVGRAGASALDLHPEAGLVAVATLDQAVRVFAADGSSVGHLKHQSGFLAQRLGPITALGFHPRRLMLAVGGTDGLVSLFSARL